MFHNINDFNSSFPISNEELSVNFNIIDTDPTHKGCIEYLMQRVPHEMVLYSNNKLCEITPEFRRILDTYWSPNGKDIIRWKYAAGFVPVQILLSKDGPVPRIVQPGAYEFKVHYNHQSAKIMILAYRLRSGVTKTHPLESLAQRDSNLESAYISSMTDTFRIDLLHEDKSFDIQAFDPTVYVITGLGYDPTITGQLRSVVSAVRDATVERRCLFNLYLQSTNRVLEAMSWAVPAAPTAAESQAMDRGTAGANSAADDGARRFFHRTVSQRRVRDMIEEEEDDYWSSFGYGTSERLTPSDAANYRFPFGARNTEHPNRCRHMEHGTTIYHNNPAQPNWGQFEFVMSDLRREIINNYGLVESLFIQRASQQGNVEMQEQRLQNTMIALNRVLTYVNTTIYQAIYGTDDARNGLHQIVQRWLRPKMLDRIIIALRAWHKNLRINMAQQATADRRVNIDGPTIDIRTLPTALRGASNFLLRQIADNPVFIKKYEKTHRYMKRNYKAPSTADAQGEHAVSPNVEDEFSDVPDERTLYGIDAFIATLERMKTDDIWRLFKSLPESDDDAVWFRSKERKVRDKGERELASANIIVTYPSRSHQSNETLISMYLNGFATYHEIYELIRTNTDLPITNFGAHNESSPLENCRELMASQNLPRLISDTNFAPLVGLSESALRADKNNAVQIALAQYKAQQASADKAGTPKTAGSSNQKAPVSASASGAMAPGKRKDATAKTARDESEAKAQSDDKEKARRRSADDSPSSESPDSEGAERDRVRSSKRLAKRKRDEKIDGADEKEALRKKQKKKV